MGVLVCNAVSGSDAPSLSERQRIILICKTVGVLLLFQLLMEFFPMQMQGARGTRKKGETSWRFIHDGRDSESPQLGRGRGFLKCWAMEKRVPCVPSRLRMFGRIHVLDPFPQRAGIVMGSLCGRRTEPSTVALTRLQGHELWHGPLLREIAHLETRQSSPPPVSQRGIVRPGLDEDAVDLRDRR